MLLIFELNDTEVFIPNDQSEGTPESSQRNKIIAYPMIWADNFGLEYYRHAQMEELLTLSETPTEHLNDNGEPYKTDTEELNITDKEEISSTINNLISEFQQEVH